MTQARGSHLAMVRKPSMMGIPWKWNPDNPDDAIRWASRELLRREADRYGRERSGVEGNTASVATRLRVGHQWPITCICGLGYVTREILTGFTRLRVKEIT